MGAQNPAKMKPHTIYFDDDTWEKLLEAGFNARPREPVTAIVQRYVREGLERNGTQARREVRS